jgi:hypothetical protein
MCKQEVKKSRPVSKYLLAIIFRQRAKRKCRQAWRRKETGRKMWRPEIKRKAGRGDRKEIFVGRKERGVDE